MVRSAALAPIGVIVTWLLWWFLWPRVHIPVHVIDADSSMGVTVELTGLGTHCSSLKSVVLRWRRMQKPTVQNRQFKVLAAAPLVVSEENWRGCTFNIPTSSLVGKGKRIAQEEVTVELQGHASYWGPAEAGVITVKFRQKADSSWSWFLALWQFVVGCFSLLPVFGLGWLPRLPDLWRRTRRRLWHSQQRKHLAELWERLCVEVLQLRISLAECFRHMSIPECPICFDRRVLWIRGPCGHGACRGCMQEHLRVNGPELIQRMKQARSFNVGCFLPDCEELLDPSLVAVFTPDMAPLVNNVRCREKLIGRNPEGWVECPSMSCVGVGYRGQKQVMCFLCERQWDDPRYSVLNRFVDWVKSWWPSKIDGAPGARPCPHCGVAILKNGGCPNMRCALCRRTFYWGPFSNDTEGVNPNMVPN